MNTQPGLTFGKEGGMVFPLRTIYAQAYTTVLLSAGVDFAVAPREGRVDIITPFELRAGLFPRPEWMEDYNELPNSFGDNYVSIPGC